jgi:hypothetical protein
LIFVAMCGIAGVLIGYLTEGGSLWLAIGVGTGLLIPSLILGWFAGKWGERLGRDWRDAREARSGKSTGELGEDR